MNLFLLGSSKKQARRWAFSVDSYTFLTYVACGDSKLLMFLFPYQQWCSIFLIFVSFSVGHFDAKKKKLWLLTNWTFFEFSFGFVSCIAFFFRLFYAGENIILALNCAFLYFSGNNRKNGRIGEARVDIWFVVESI